MTLSARMRGHAVKIGRIGPVGSEKPVVFVNEHQAIDVSSIVDDWSRESLSSGAVERVEKSLSTLPTVDIAGQRVAAPIARPTKVICIGLNYKKHAEETGATAPTEPVIFMKTPDSVVGPHDGIEIPPGSTKTDYEVELAVVIGQRLRYASSPEEAMAAVLGYTISQDISERHWQLERGGQWDKGKGFPTFNPCGPWIETSPDFNPQNARLTCMVDGEVRQDSNTSDMIFSIAEIVRYTSQCMELFPGDIINTGTPQGVGMGMTPTGFLMVGQRVETEIEGIGQIASTTIDATRS